MTLREQLSATATAFAAHSGLAVATISTRVFNDGKVLAGVMAGRDLTTGRFERAMRWFSDNWPAGAEWPDGIDRPNYDEAQPGRIGCVRVAAGRGAA